MKQWEQMSPKNLDHIPVGNHQHRDVPYISRFCQLGCAYVYSFIWSLIGVPRRFLWYVFDIKDAKTLQTIDFGVLGMDKFGAVMIREHLALS